MSTKRGRSGSDVAQPNPPKGTLLASAAERVAPGAEDGKDLGAPPSNTAPNNSNTKHQGAFKLLRLAVDSLYLSYVGELKPDVFASLTDLKVKAQSQSSQLAAQAQYVAGGHIFEVKDKGTGRFPFVLEDNAFRIQLSSPGNKLPMAYVKVSAEYLAYRAPFQAEEELAAILGDMGVIAGANTVSRVDLAADFVAGYEMDSWHRSAWVTHASEIHSYAQDQKFTGWTIGMKGAISARLYNKTREIEHSGKAWARDLWLPMGWSSDEQVWRLEFELKREFLSQKALSSLDSVMHNLDGLWSYATTEWLRLTLPSSTDTTRSRWPTHPLWMALASVDWETDGGPLLTRFNNARLPDERHLTALTLGCIVSYMAMHNTADCVQAINKLLVDVYDRYSAKAKSDGFTFAELVNRRAALRARAFNTIVNTPRTVAPASTWLEPTVEFQVLEDAINAYIRASRGE